MSKENTTAVESQQVQIFVNGEEEGKALIQQELQMLRERYAQKMSHLGWRKSRPRWSQTPVKMPSVPLPINYEPKPILKIWTWWMPSLLEM